LQEVFYDRDNNYFHPATTVNHHCVKHHDRDHHQWYNCQDHNKHYDIHPSTSVNNRGYNHVWSI
jgi:hypothetical protein